MLKNWKTQLGRPGLFLLLASCSLALSGAVKTEKSTSDPKEQLRAECAVLLVENEPQWQSLAKDNPMMLLKIEMETL